MTATRIEPPEGYEGVQITLGKSIYVAPPLTLKALRVLMPKIAALSDPATTREASFDILSELVHTTLKRNYPALTQDEVEDGLDMKNVTNVMSAILEASGLKQGNVQAATENP
jgi:hypothetical protein